MNNRRRVNGRVTLAVLTLFAVVLAFGVRLIDIQVVQADELNDEAAGKRSIPETTYGTRGGIVDANGQELAYSVTRYNVKVAPNVMLEKGVTEHLKDNLAAIGAVTGQDPDALLKILTDNPESNFAYLAKDLDTETFREVRDLGIGGVYFERKPSRVYPNGAIAGNLVGFVGTDGAQAGIELGRDECLAATDGKSTYERSEDGIPLPGSEVVVSRPTDGGTIHLTVDRDLQWYVQQTLGERVLELGADWGTAWVVRVKDGHVMAAADYPTLDPNDIDNAPRDANGNMILGSRSFAIPYEPGSTFKAMSVAMLLDAGVVTPTTQITAPGIFRTPTGQTLHDAWAHGDLRYTMAGVLVYSSNTGISTVADRLSASQRYEYMRAFGLGEKTEVDFVGESAGLLRPGEQWDGLTTYNVMFGQGVAATSAQVASIYQTIANGGVRMPLTLVTGCENSDGTISETPVAEGRRVVSEQAADNVVAILENVVTQGGLRHSVDIPGYRVAAKTGTAEVARRDGSGYGGERIVSVAGMAPAEDPEYVVVVTLGRPDTMKSGVAAGPTFDKIMSQTLTTFRVAPSSEPAPEIPLTW